MQYRFTHLSGTNVNQVDHAETMPVTLGRDDKCQIRFDKYKELAVSLEHCRIEEPTEDTFEVHNLSKNGVLVNGIVVDTKAKLPNHATIQLGRDGPRVRFDVEQYVGGISKADVQKKTQKFQRKDVPKGPVPETEERPVFNVAEGKPRVPTKPQADPGTAIVVAIGVGIGVVIFAILALVLH